MSSTIQKAINDARSKVSASHQIETDRWAYNVWSDFQQAWLSSLRSDNYPEARRKRAATISSIAVRSLPYGDAVSESTDGELALRIIAIAYSRATAGRVENRVKETPAVDYTGTLCVASDPLSARVTRVNC